jgi:chloramphenicol 3-O-phosphotransferase
VPLTQSYAAAGFTPIIDYVIVSEADLREYRRQLPGLDVHFVVLHPGKAVVIAREAAREKSRRHKAKHGLTIGEHFAHLEKPLVEQLAGVGFWIDNAELTPPATADLILANRERARLP